MHLTSTPSRTALFTLLLLLALLTPLISSSHPSFPSHPLPPPSPHSHPGISSPNSTFAPLQHLLSPTAQILLPFSPKFSSLLSSRWSLNPNINRPSPSAIIVPATEADISATIRYCNALVPPVPFLAMSGGHGTTRWLADLKGDGVLIYLGSLDRLEVNEEDGTAVVGGGSVTAEVTRRLWEKGYQTTTGVCECVGYLGPLLGGGHGWLQGRYGLAADQLVSARVVLGSGEVVDVSKTENEDLFWGLMGAGHNFGVVSEVKVKVHKVEGERKMWAWEKFIFPGELMEEVYDVAELMLVGQPAHVNQFSVWLKDATIDPGVPVITYYVMFNGPLVESRKYTSLFHALGPVRYYSGETEYPGLPAVLGAGLSGPLCGIRQTAYLGEADVNKYNLADLRNWMNVFTAMLKAVPDLDNSICMLEQYSVQGVQAVPAESTAYPHRAQRLLLAPVIAYNKVGNQTLDAEAERWNKAMVTAAFGGSKRRTYVNYAHGDESLQAVYGYEPWRLEKLRNLKMKYDPDNQFRFYEPIEY